MDICMESGMDISPYLSNIIYHTFIYVSIPIHHHHNLIHPSIHPFIHTLGVSQIDLSTKIPWCLDTYRPPQMDFFAVPKVKNYGDGRDGEGGDDDEVVDGVNELQKKRNVSCYDDDSDHSVDSNDDDDDGNKIKVLFTTIITLSTIYCIIIIIIIISWSFPQTSSSLSLSR